MAFHCRTVLRDKHIASSPVVAGFFIPSGKTLTPLVSGSDSQLYPGAHPREAEAPLEPEKHYQGRTHGAQGARGPLWDLKNTIFSGFRPLNYVICIFEVCFLSFLLCGRTEEACSMVNSLR